jgi:hypothetical protein
MLKTIKRWLMALVIEKIAGRRVQTAKRQAIVLHLGHEQRGDCERRQPAGGAPARF